MNQECFIDEEKLNRILERQNNPSNEEIYRILEKALLLKGLDIDDAAALLSIRDKALLDKLFKTALKIKNEIYGERLVLFAPLYVSNFCSNNCLYCGFRHDNKSMERKCLSVDEVKEEVKNILSQGHKRILMLMGESHRECELDYFMECVEAAYSVKDDKGNSLRRINVEIAPLTPDEFQKLKRIKIGTYTVFQETYHRETYKKMHPVGKKADYLWRLNVMDRALANGLHDVGIGALFGLYDYRFEVIALLEHAKHLDSTFGTGPHTISIPRIEPAENAPAAMSIPYPVGDEDFKKIVAILRCAVPYTGIILSTRENAEMRQELFDLGVSQISAGSKTNPGGYSKANTGAQFTTGDTRTAEEVISSVINLGFIPSFCTACYRKGRVGKDFMELAKPGLIKEFCQPNAILTLQEYLEDYADDIRKKDGEALIAREIETLPGSVKEKTKEIISRIKKGERDIYF